MLSQSEIHELLSDILGNDNVYFQPPENVKIKYPCIICTRDLISTNFADNLPYKHDDRYNVMLIDRNLNSSIPDELKALPKSRFDRNYTSDNLYHTVFKIYF